MSQEEHPQYMQL